MSSDMSRNGKIGAGVVVLLVLAVVAVLAVGSAVGWYDEERPQTLGPPPGQKERVSSQRNTSSPPLLVDPARTRSSHSPAEELFSRGHRQKASTELRLGCNFGKI